MSYIRIGPTITEISTHTCRFHKEHPFGTWAGCTCSSSISVREKPREQWTDAERAYMADPYPGARY